jgi:hypothetical protein
VVQDEIFCAEAAMQEGSFPEFMIWSGDGLDKLKVHLDNL